MTKFIDLHAHSTFSSAMTAGDALEFSDVEAAWLAGILEGEGWFGERHPSPSDRYRHHSVPLIAVKMCDRDILQKVAQLFGGVSVSQARGEIGNSKAQWYVRAQGIRAISIMKVVLPYMGKRRTEQIEMLLWLYDD